MFSLNCLSCCIATQGSFDLMLSPVSKPLIESQQFSFIDLRSTVVVSLVRVKSDFGTQCHK